MKLFLKNYFIVMVLASISAQAFGGVLDAVGGAVNTASNIAQDALHGAGQIVHDVTRPGHRPERGIDRFYETEISPYSPV